MSDTENTNCYQVCNIPKYKRMVLRMFKWHTILPELPEWAKDGVVSTINIDFSFKDRLVLLLTGRVSVKIFNACENIPGRVETIETSVITRPPEFFEH